MPSLSPAQHGWLADERLQAVFSALEADGGRARVVGGAIRNALLGETVADIDIATSEPPDRIIALSTRAGLRHVPTGIDHGTVTILSGVHGHAKPFEVTTLRRDVATDGRRAEVTFTDDWAEDAARRDFTINALYCDRHGTIFDPLGGLADVQARCVRFVGDPVARIREDYLRILRFFRFTARYVDDGPEPTGLAACIAEQAGLSILSAERIRQEWLKLVTARHALPIVGEMVASGICDRVLGQPLEPTLLARLVALEHHLDLPPDSLLRTATLAGAGSDLATRLRDRLRLTNHELDRLRNLAAAAPVKPALRPTERRAILYHLGASTWRDTVQIGWSRSPAAPDDPDWLALYRLPDDWPMPIFPLRGADLLAQGMPPGRALGELLRELEDWWIATDFQLGADELMARMAALRATR